MATRMATETRRLFRIGEDGVSEESVRTSLPAHYRPHAMMGKLLRINSPNEEPQSRSSLADLSEGKDLYHEVEDRLP